MTTRRVSGTPVGMTRVSRASLHWGDCASWRDGGRGFGCDAGLGAQPPEVYLPPAGAWATQAPAWAAGLRPRVVDDFEVLGARVVDVSGARLHWHGDEG